MNWWQLYIINNYFPQMLPFGKSKKMICNNIMIFVHNGVAKYSYTAFSYYTCYKLATTSDALLLVICGWPFGVQWYIVPLSVSVTLKICNPIVMLVPMSRKFLCLCNPSMRRPFLYHCASTRSADWISMIVHSNKIVFPGNAITSLGCCKNPANIS